VGLEAVYVLENHVHEVDLMFLFSLDVKEYQLINHRVKIAVHILAQ
jgi:hypothetical protein